MPSSKSESTKGDSDSESKSPIPQKPMKSLWNGELDDVGEEHQNECVMYWDEDQECLVKGIRFKEAPFHGYKSLCGTYDWVWNGYPDRDEQVHSYDGSITLELEAHVDNQEVLANIHGTITWGDYRGTYKGFEKHPSVHHNYFDILNPINWHDTRTDLEPSEDEEHSFALAQINDESGNPFIIYYFDSGDYYGHGSFGRWGIVGKKRQGAKYATLTHKEELLLGIGSTRSALMKRAGFIPNRRLSDHDLWYQYGGLNYPKYWEHSKRQVTCGVKLLKAKERDLQALSATYTLFWYNRGIIDDCTISTDDPDDDSDSFGVVNFSIGTSIEGASAVNPRDIGGFVDLSDCLEGSMALKIEFRGVMPHAYHPSFFDLNVIATRKGGGDGEDDESEGESDNEDGVLIQHCVAWSEVQDDDGIPFLIFCVHEDEALIYIGKKDGEGSQFHLSEAEKRRLGIGCSKSEVMEMNGIERRKPKIIPPPQEKKRQMPQGEGSSQGASKKAKTEGSGNSGGRQKRKKRKGKGGKK